MISAHYESTDAGIRGLPTILTPRIQMTGFIIYEHEHKLSAHQARVAPWLRSGELVFHEDVVRAFENSPAALMGMMMGKAIGRRLVQVVAE